jgi:SMODS-associated and fused to various effectors sensor domain
MVPRGSSTAPTPTQVIGPGGATRSIPDRVALRVWVAAGGRCTVCNRYLLGDEYTGTDVLVGQLAHIVGWTTTAGSPRGEDPLPVTDRNLEDNLMLLCYDQHRVIDNRSLWETYDAGTLRAMKRRHEQRIRQLTDLHDDDRSTVLRMVSDLHGAGVELSRQTIATALLSNDRFPEYALLGANEFEIDLRATPGEADGTPEYWAATRALISDRLRLLRVQVGQETIRHLSVFAIARIPLLITLGVLLDDTVPTDVYPKRRDNGEGWGWDATAPTMDFTVTPVRAGTDPHRVAVLFSISGSIDIYRLPADLAATATIYEVHPVGVTPGIDVVRTQAPLDNFARAWRNLLSQFERDHPGLPAIHAFAAVPVTAAVTIGRSVMSAIHPPLRVYDRDTRNATYQFAMEATR